MKKTFFILLFVNVVFLFSQENSKLEIPITAIEEVPTHISCNSFTTNSEKKKCMRLLLEQHIQNNFNFDLANCLRKKTSYNRKKGHEKKCVPVLLSGEKRMYLNFTISERGEIEDISAKAPHQKLKEEAIRVGQLIPKMIPGKQQGKPVRVAYKLPIDFTVK